MTLHLVYGDTPIGEYFPTWDAHFFVCRSLEQSDLPGLAICKMQNKGSSSGEDIIPCHTGTQVYDSVDSIKWSRPKGRLYYLINQTLGGPLGRALRARAGILLLIQRILPPSVWELTEVHNKSTCTFY